MGKKVRIAGSALFFLCMTFILNTSFAKDFLIASFESAHVSDLGTEMGTWSSNPLDTSQGTTMEVIPMYYEIGRASCRERVCLYV